MLLVSFSLQIELTGQQLHQIDISSFLPFNLKHHV